MFALTMTHQPNVAESNIEHKFSYSQNYSNEPSLWTSRGMVMTDGTEAHPLIMNTLTSVSYKLLELI